MQRLIRSFDACLRRAFGIFELGDNPDGLLRVRLIPAPHEISLPGGRVAAGAPVLELHVWNEHVPQIGAQGPDLAWAVETRRLLISSLCHIAWHLGYDARFGPVQAVGGVTILAAPFGGMGSGALFNRLGFTIFPCHSPLGRFGEFWANLYLWTLIWAYNKGSLRRRHFWGLQRNEIWMSAEDFLSRYDR